MKKASLVILLALLFSVNSYGITDQADSVILAQAEQARMSKNFDLEIDILLKGDSLFPRSQEILWRLSRSFAEKASRVEVTNMEQALPFRKDFFTTSLNYAKQAEEVAPYSPQGYYYQAIAMGGIVQYGTYKEMTAGAAIIKTNAEKAIALDSNHHRALHILGRWHYEVARLSSFVKLIANIFYSDIPKGTYDEAIINFKKAYAVKKLDIHQLWLAKSYIKLNKKEEAIEELKKVIENPILEINDSTHKAEAKKLLDELTLQK